MLDTQKQVNLLVFVANLVRYVVMLLQLLLTVPLLFSIFPQTKSLAYTLFSYIWNPIKVILNGIADGQSPEEPYLYGITNSHAIYTPTVPRGITRIDLVTQEISEVIQFHDGEDFCLAANIPGTNILCGIREKICHRYILPKYHYRMD